MKTDMDTRDYDLTPLGVFEEYELCIIRESARKYEARDGGLFSAELKVEEGMSLRALDRGRLAFAFTFARGEGGLRDLARKAGELLPLMEEDRDQGFPHPGESYPLLPLLDRKGLDTAPEEKVARLARFENSIRGSDRRIVTTRNCELTEAELEVRIINSKGADVRHAKSLYSLFGLAVAAEEEEVSFYDWRWGHSLDDVDFDALARAIAEKTLASLGAVQLETGVYEGIFTPRAASELLEVLSASFLGENLYKKKTRLDGRAGEVCFSPAISIIDSGLTGMGACPFDGEGVPSTENRVVDRGRFTGFLFDTYYGNKLDHPSTANSVRGGIKEAPRCSPRGIYIEAGTRDLLPLVTNGIVIDELIGVHTANPITGDLSLGAVGHMVRDGKKTPFQGVVVAGNLFDLFRSVREAGSDLTFYGTVGTPSLYVEGIKVSGR